MDTFTPFITKINDIINQDYDISNIEKFASGINLELDEVMDYFRFIESRDLYVVEKDILSKYYGKQVNVKLLTKNFYMKETDYDLENDKVSCAFFKKFLSCVNVDKYNSFEKIEMIIISDMIKKNLHFSTDIIKTNMFSGVITLEEKDGFIIMEFVKSKEKKDINLEELYKSNKSIVFSFSFDKSKDDVKPFSDNIKQLVSDCLDIYNRKKEREIEMENIKIKESLDNLDKEERKQKEKEKLVKFVKSTAKSEGISVKTNTFILPNTDIYDKEKFIKSIETHLKNYSTLEFKEVSKSLEKDNIDDKEENTNEDNNNSDGENNSEEEDFSLGL
jgi:hypothetical protein